MLEKLLRPLDETLNEHKRMQLRELASLNGGGLVCSGDCCGCLGPWWLGKAHPVP